MANVVTRRLPALGSGGVNASGEKGEKGKRHPTASSDLKRTISFLFVTGVLGTLALLVWALTRDDWTAAFGFGLLLLGSAGLVGGFLGLLFGIPKSVSDPALASAARGRENESLEATNTSKQRPSYAANTNLEQISDWLTKIIVGVSLTQIGTIREQFGQLAAYFGPALANASSGGADPTGSVAAAALITYGLTAGFLAGYLLTRMFLPGAFVRADEALRQEVGELEKEVGELEKSLAKTDNDLTARNLFALGNIAEGQGRLTDAEVYYRRATTKSPHVAYAGLASVFLARAEMEPRKKNEHIQEALSYNAQSKSGDLNDEKRGGVHLQRAEILAYTNDSLAAAEALKEAIDSFLLAGVPATRIRGHILEQKHLKKAIEDAKIATIIEIVSTLKE